MPHYRANRVKTTLTPAEAMLEACLNRERHKKRSAKADHWPASNKADAQQDCQPRYPRSPFWPDPAARAGMDQKCHLGGKPQAEQNNIHPTDGPIFLPSNHRQ